MSRAHFGDRLFDAVERTGSAGVIGLDPHLHLLPDSYGEVARDPAAPREARAEVIADFLIEVIDAARGKMPAVKPQSAFFEALGADGVRAYERVVRAAREAGFLVIADVKRGDIGSTAAAYAQAFLSGAPGLEDDPSLADAATVNPYLGSDSIQPFLDACDAAGGGIYVLVRTSNPSSAEFQTLESGGNRVSDHVADAVDRWGGTRVGERGWSSVGAVVGATHPDELARLRQRMPRTPLLIPGYGAQGGGAEGLVGAFRGGLHGALVNSSRGLLFPERLSAEEHWKDATCRAIDAMNRDLAAAIKG